MTVADTNTTSLAWQVEATYNVAPTSGSYQPVRLTSESLKRNTGTIVSDEIVSDRQVTDTIRTSVAGGGDVGVELSSGTHDTWYEYGLMSGAWGGSQAHPAVNIAVTLTSPNTTFTRATGDFTAEGFAAGQIVRVSGSSDSLNNGYWKIVTPGTTAMVLQGTGAAVADAAGVTIAQLDQITTGTTLKSIAFERTYGGPTSQYAQITGASIQSFSLEVNKDDKVVGSVTFLAADEIGATSALSTTGTATTSRVYSVTGDLDTFVFNGDRAAKMTRFSLNYSNGLYEISSAGVLGLEQVGRGEANCSGSYEMYYEDQTVFDDVESFGDVSTLLAFEDSSGNGHVFDIPALNLTDGARNVTGKSAAVLGSVTWQAKKHGTEGITMRMART